MLKLHRTPRPALAKETEKTLTYQKKVFKYLHVNVNKYFIYVIRNAIAMVLVCALYYLLKEIYLLYRVFLMLNLQVYSFRIYEPWN